MKTEKWIDGTVVDDEGVWRKGKVINPAYVTELEAFAKEMARFVKMRSDRVSDFDGARTCAGCSVVIEKYTLDGWPVCPHDQTCPVLRAQEYLTKGRSRD